mgnify:CR=1 FL=1
MTTPNQSPDPSRRQQQPQTEPNQELPALPSAPRVIDILCNGRRAPEYYSGVLTILQDAHNQVPVSVTSGGRRQLERLGLVEWSQPYPDFIAKKGVPFFAGDFDLHDQIDQTYVKLQNLTNGTTVDPRISKRARGRVLLSEEARQFLAKVDTIRSQLRDALGQLQKRHNFFSVPTEGGFLRLTEMGRSFMDTVHKQSPEHSLLIVKTLLKLPQVTPRGRTNWEHLANHIRKITRELPDTDLQLRKLYFGIITKAVDTSENGLRQRFREIEAEHYTDLFLRAPMSELGGHSLRWLQRQSGGNFCPPPYPSWKKEEKRECQEESRKIVTRARLHAYTTFNKLRLETKRIGGEDSLAARFAQDSYERVSLVYGSDIDMPPGRGIMMVGPRLEKLFHPSEAAPDDPLANYRESNRAWFAPAYPHYENTTVIQLRGWIGVLNPCEDFKLFGTRYCFLVDNHHLSPLYGLAFGIPEAVVAKKIKPCLQDPTAARGAPAPSDLSRLDASIHGLIEASIEAKLPPLAFGTMSQLFGGMVNALPVGYSPTLHWERERHTGLWKDVFNHVHWSWLVWPYREHRPKVDERVAPMAAMDKQLRRFAVTGQQLLDCHLDRYAAWKNDFTPGAKSAPRMLVEAYKIHRALKAGHPSMSKGEKIYIGAYDMENPGGKPAAWINCETLQILRKRGGPIQLPESSDGTENLEVNLWRKHIQPLLAADSGDGVAREGQYELAIVGEKDL